MSLILHSVVLHSYMLVKPLYNTPPPLSYQCQSLKCDSPELSYTGTVAAASLRPTAEASEGGCSPIPPFPPWQDARYTHVSGCYASGTYQIPWEAAMFGAR